MSKDLHDQIMNIACRRADDTFLNQASRLLYKEGHRDARHDAAELALAASGGNAAPELPEPVYIPVDVPYDDEVKAYTAEMMTAYGKACAAASAPNAALVAALRTFVVAFEGRNPFHYSEYLNEDDIIAGRAALSAVGQEVGK